MWDLISIHLFYPVQMNYSPYAVYGKFAVCLQIIVLVIVVFVFLHTFFMLHLENKI